MKRAEAHRLFEEAALLFLDLGLFKQSAKCFSSFGKFKEAAELFSRVSCWKEAGECYAAIQFYKEAAECYCKANKILEALLGAPKKKGSWPRTSGAGPEAKRTN
jgi:tetratricopeptide (TPR) repeat protein